MFSQIKKEVPAKRRHLLLISRNLVTTTTIFAWSHWLCFIDRHWATVGLIWSLALWHAWEARALHNSQYRAPLQVNWLADWREEAVIERLNMCKRENGARRVATHSPFSEIPLRLWQRLTEAALILDEQQWAKLPKANLLKLATELCRGAFQVVGKGVFKDEFVTCGGVALNEVNFKTMESRVQPGLFFAGEILDIDGITGGFNFQNAWTTAWIAGQARAEIENSELRMQK